MLTGGVCVLRTGYGILVAFGASCEFEKTFYSAQRAMEGTLIHIWENNIQVWVIFFPQSNIRRIKLEQEAQWPLHDIWPLVISKRTGKNPYLKKDTRIHISIQFQWLGLKGLTFKGEKNLPFSLSNPTDHRIDQPVWDFISFQKIHLYCSSDGYLFVFSRKRIAVLSVNNSSLPSCALAGCLPVCLS